jgi:hypothetical protein
LKEFQQYLVALPISEMINMNQCEPVARQEGEKNRRNIEKYGREMRTE